MFTALGRSRSVAVLGGSVAVCLLLAACGGSGGSEAASAGSGGSGKVPAEVTAIVEKNLPNPTSVGYDQPLSTPVPKKKIVALQVAVDITKVENEAMRKAAEALGWDFDTVVIGPGPEAPAKAFDAAIDKQPDGIYYSGQPAASVSKQLKRAKDAGIEVFAEAVGEDTPPEAFTQIRSQEAVVRLADVNAAWIVKDSGASADVLVVNTPAFTVIDAYAKRVESRIKEWCPACKISIMNVQATDIGTAIPGQIVSQLQRSPKTNYLVYGFGDLSAGVSAALSTAGVQDKVKTTGQLPGLDNLKRLKDGTEAMWVPELSPLVGWRVIDAFARQFIGDDPNIAADKSPNPTQILTPDNVNDSVFDPSGYWVGVAGYQEIFKKMWNVG